MFLILEVVLLVAILVVLIGILTAIKNGFNEVIKGLEVIAVSSASRGS